jgi:hypothetical protein
LKSASCVIVIMTIRTLKLLGAVAILVIIALSMGGRLERMDMSGAGPWYPPSGSGRPHISPFTPPVIDRSGGCEGGSCVNIPRW